MIEKMAFDAVVTEHGATVLRVCIAVLGPTDADDAWSETFLSAVTAYPDLPPDANVEAWLVTIAHRKAIDIIRAESRRAVPLERVPDVVPAPSTEELDPDLLSALAQLAPKQKQAVAYHFLAGLPYSEVARIIGGSAEAARRSGADGIAALRRHYVRLPKDDTGGGRERKQRRPPAKPATPGQTGESS